MTRLAATSVTLASYPGLGTRLCRTASGPIQENIVSSVCNLVLFWFNSRVRDEIRMTIAAYQTLYESR